MSFMFSLMCSIIYSVYSFNLDTVSSDTLEPKIKPLFLKNATDEVVDQFMGIARTQGITQHRKVTELEVLIGTLRPDVQSAFQDYKAESLMAKLAQDERYQEVVAKMCFKVAWNMVHEILDNCIHSACHYAKVCDPAHYVIAHLNALKNASKLGDNEKKTRTELIFTEFSNFVVDAVTEEVSHVVENMMRMMLRAILFTEKWGLK